MINKMMNETIQQRAQAIRLLILDVDGVLTDGRLYFSEQGHELKVFHVHDGLGLKQLLKAGITVAVISGRQSPQTTDRMKELGIELVFQGISDKLAVYEQLRTQLKLQDEQIACVGDDVPEIPLFEYAGLGIAVQNAQPALKHVAHWITELPGGHGAVREVCELLLTSSR